MANPKLAMIPSGYGVAEIYSVLPTTGIGDFSFSRNSVATRVNKSNIIEEVSVNTPRLDYSDGGCPSLLLESTRTNLVTYSESFDNAYWTKNGSSITSGFTSPDGTANAFKLTKTGSGNSILGVIQGLTNVSYTNSFYIKRVSGTGNISLILPSGATESISIDNNWKRYSVTSLQSGFGAFIGLVLSQINDEVLIYGATLEAGSYSTSYIKSNNGTTITRLADTCNNNISSITTVENTNTVVLKFIPIGVDVDFYSLLSFSDGTNQIKLEGYQGNIYDVFGSGLGSGGMINGSLSLNADSVNIISFSYSGTNLIFSHNGNTIATTTPTGNLPTIKEILHSTGGLNPIKILKLEVYNDFKTQQEINNLTVI